MTTSDIQILNGRILHNDGYINDFHEFISEKFVQLQVVLPGIIIHSVRIKVVNRNVRIRANIKKEYYAIFKTSKIQLEGQLSKDIIEGPVRSSYDNGILTIDLALDNDIR